MSTNKEFHRFWWFRCFLFSIAIRQMRALETTFRNSICITSHEPIFLHACLCQSFAVSMHMEALNFAFTKWTDLRIQSSAKGLSNRSRRKHATCAGRSSNHFSYVGQFVDRSRSQICVRRCWKCLRPVRSMRKRCRRLKSRTLMRIQSRVENAQNTGECQSNDERISIWVTTELTFWTEKKSVHFGPFISVEFD